MAGADPPVSESELFWRHSAAKVPTPIIAFSLFCKEVPMMADKGQRSRVFLDVSIGTEPIGRLVFELFADKAPKTCEK